MTGTLTDMAEIRTLLGTPTLLINGVSENRCNIDTRQGRTQPKSQKSTHTFGAKPVTIGLQCRSPSTPTTAVIAISLKPTLTRNKPTPTPEQ